MDETVATGYVIDSFPIRRSDVVASQRHADRMAKKLRIDRSELSDDGWGRARSEHIREVILADRPGATCSDSNWTKIMKKGREAHEGIQAGAPYCDDV
jgi:hypothetical protein